jgi:hypothetical protein
MKKIICLFILLLSTSCSSFKIPDKFQLFFDDVIQHPEKLSNIQKNYPEYYSENFTPFLKNQYNYLADLISRFNKYYGKIKYYEMHMSIPTFLEIDKYQLYYNKIDSIDTFYIFVAHKNHAIGIKFIFVKTKEDIYYLFDIYEISNFWNHSSRSYIDE